MALYPKVLFFISGMVPTPEQTEAANAFGPGTVFRNADLIVEGAPIEDADAVAGDAPQQYKDALPDAGDTSAVKERMAARDPNQQTMRRGETPYTELTDEQKEARNANALSRGARPLPVNERNNAPMMVENRTTQAGTPRVEYAAPPADDDGWSGGEDGGTPDPAAAGTTAASHPVPAGAKPGKPAQAAPAPAGDDAAARAAAARANTATANK